MRCDKCTFLFFSGSRHLNLLSNAVATDHVYLFDFIIFRIIYLFVWLHRVLAAALRIPSWQLEDFSLVVALTPERVGSVVVLNGLSCHEACRILVPLPGIKPASPALEGRGLTNGPPGKSPLI